MTRRSAPLTVDPTDVGFLVAEGAVIVDVRENFEWRTGYICGATHIPLLKLRPAAFLTRRPIIAVCRTGHRSAIAARRLRNAGLDALSLVGGMHAWRKAGLAICTDDGVVDAAAALPIIQQGPGEHDD